MMTLYEGGICWLLLIFYPVVHMANASLQYEENTLIVVPNQFSIKDTLPLHCKLL